MRREQVLGERDGQDLVRAQARVGQVADDVVEVALLGAPERLVEAAGDVPRLGLELARAARLAGEALERGPRSSVPRARAR